MIFVTDVHYLPGGEARAAAVGIREWTSQPTPAAVERTRESVGVAPYVAGRFFERELPCLLPLLRPLLAAHPASTVVVDGFVDVPEGPGLGRHLARALADAGLPAPVVGIAKSPFPGAGAVELLRGSGDTPLFISSSQSSLTEAASWVRSMAGPHRLPLAVLRADHLARGIARPGR
jgi:deoxyribonuclease V